MSESAFLLDSHVWLWLVGEEGKISKSALKKIRAAAKHQGLGVSEISFWELATKATMGKLELRPDISEWLRRAAERPGIGIVHLDREILVRSTQLDLPHGDPADRMLVATALFYDLVLITADRTLLDYARTHRDLRVLDARP